MFLLRKLLRSRLMTCFVYIAFIMSFLGLLLFMWLENSPANNIYFDGPELFKAHKPKTTHFKFKTKLSSAEHFDFNCRKLFDNDFLEVQRAKLYLRYHRYNFTHINDEYYKELTVNCRLFIESRHYHIKQSSSDSIEKSFPIAFNILFHQNVEQLERVLRSIYRPQNQYCIHVDRKTADEVLDAVRSITQCFDNVFIVSKLEIVVYASYTRLLADINCMKDHIKRKSEWKYLINMASSEFPVMSNLQMVQILQHFNGSNDIHEVFTGIDADRFKRKHFTYLDMRARTGHMIHTDSSKGPPPMGLTITKGNAYNVFSRAFIEFVLNDDIARALLAWSADTLTPDEHYWATLNNLYSNPFLNTPGGFKGHPDKKPYFGRYIGWNTTKHVRRCKAGHFVHNVCVFSVEDLPLLETRHELIANKFDIDYDPVAYTCMEELVRNKTRDKVPVTYEKYYRKIAGVF